MGLAQTIARSIELNEHFQFVALSAEQPSDAFLREVVERALPHLVDRCASKTADVTWVDTWQQAVEHVLGDAASLTIFDGFAHTPDDVDRFVNGINTHRDTMRGGRAPSTLVLLYPRSLAPMVGRYRDIMSCAQWHALP